MLEDFLLNFVAGLASGAFLAALQRIWRYCVDRTKRGL